MLRTTGKDNLADLGCSVGGDASALEAVNDREEVQQRVLGDRACVVHISDAIGFDFGLVRLLLRLVVKSFLRVVDGLLHID